MHPSNIAGTNILRVRLSEENRRFLNIDDVSDAVARGHTSTELAKIINDIKSNQVSNGFETQPISEWKDKFGRNALHYAAMKGRVSVIKLLLQHDFKPNIYDIHGSFPLHLAIQSNRYEAAIELCKISKANLVNYKKDSAILLLSKNRYHPKMIELLSELIKYKNDINLTDSRQCNALFYAVDKPLLMKQLLLHGINVNQKDNFNRTALFNAVYATNVEATQLLIHAGSEIQIKDDFEHTPLMLACCFAGVEIVNVLIRYGANVNGMIHVGMTDSCLWMVSPLTLAIKHANFDVAKELVMHGADLDCDIAQNETIWDLLNYDFDDDGDIEMEDLDTIELSDNMDLEVYSLGVVAKMNPARGFWKKVDLNWKRQRRQSLLEYMEETHTQRKMASLIDTELVKKLKIPKDILNIIASPLVWH